MLKKAKEKFQMLDELLQKYFTEQFVVVFGLLFLGIATFVATFNVTALLLFIGLAVSYAIVIYYRLMKCFEEKIVTLEGEVYFVYEKKKIKDKFSLERNHFILKQGDNYIKVYMGNVRKIREGNELRVYLEPSQLIRKNEDTYVCNGIFHVAVTKTGNKKETLE